MTDAQRDPVTPPAGFRTYFINAVDQKVWVKHDDGRSERANLTADEIFRMLLRLHNAAYLDWDGKP